MVSMKHLGLIGLGTMGANLARNAARNDATVAVYNRTTARTDEFIHAYASEGAFIGCHTYEELVQALPQPRAILLMVKAGPPVDTVIEDLLPLLSKGDMLIDGGNSHYKDTSRREQYLAEKGIHFVGMGVSGGEEGALHGPSMMPGGSKESYKALEPLLKEMAADDGDGGKCVTHVGPGGAGHFVKMVHNGIEYGIMQLIAESYDMLRKLGGHSNAELAEIYAKWNASEELHSFLVEITAKIFTVKDEETGEDLIDVIKDAAGQKGTGRWTTEAAMQYGVAIPTINAAVDARIFSADTELRSAVRGTLPQVMLRADEPEYNADDIKQALLLGSMNCYTQGFLLIEKASRAEQWNVSLSEIARIWKGGCIIRSNLLKEYQALYGPDPKAQEAAKEKINEYLMEGQPGWRQVVAEAMHNGIPVPAMAASLSYFDSLCAEDLPTNLIQAQRDFFGAHSFERTDKEGSFHAEWQ
ncbi:MAG: hypothetical protein JWM56_244 [Candidatus Peribacteria bacterium]|nr:hypothetical protein [Candidatus Peribacteria bacterium]